MFWIESLWTILGMYTLNKKMNFCTQFNGRSLDGYEVLFALKELYINTIYGSVANLLDKMEEASLNTPPAQSSIYNMLGGIKADKPTSRIIYFLENSPANKSAKFKKSKMVDQAEVVLLDNSLKTLRESRGYKVRELSKLTGLLECHINWAESRKPISKDTVRALASSLEVEIICDGMILQFEPVIAKKSTK